MFALARPLLFPLILLVGCSTFSEAQDPDVLSSLLWPLPQSVNFTQSFFTLSSQKDFSFVISKHNSSLLTKAVKRYESLVFYPSVEPASRVAALKESHSSAVYSKPVKSLEIVVSSSDETLGSATREDYTLSISSPTSTLSSKSVFGAIRGLETFSQLVLHINSSTYVVAEASIEDEPRFSYRGFLVDSARHFLSVTQLYMHLDALAYNKFNVLHWHIVDDQAFPYTSKVFPDLSAKGAYDENHLYSSEDIANVIEYGYERGVRVIPEFDTPGHSTSWGPGQPGLLTTCYDTDGEPSGSFGPINPIVNTTYDFLKDFFKEVFSVFKDDFVHLGGDEVLFGCWESNPNITAWMNSRNYTDYKLLESYYEQQLAETLVEAQKEMGENRTNHTFVVWEEVFENTGEFNSTSPDSLVVDVWKSGWNQTLANVTQAGYRAILSAPWYLNYISYGAVWQGYYTVEPTDFDGTAAQKKLVVGGEGCMWGEYVDNTNAISRTWPNAAAIGERLWSDETVNNVTEAAPRFANIHCRMIRRGLPAEPGVGPGFCSQEYEVSYVTPWSL